jgi:hypothetical protein
MPSACPQTTQEFAMGIISSMCRKTKQLGSPFQTQKDGQKCPIHNSFITKKELPLSFDKRTSLPLLQK